MGENAQGLHTHIYIYIWKICIYIYIHDAEIYARLPH